MKGQGFFQKCSSPKERKSQGKSLVSETWASIGGKLRVYTFIYTSNQQVFLVYYVSVIAGESLKRGLDKSLGSCAATLSSACHLALRQFPHLSKEGNGNTSLSEL